MCTDCTLVYSCVPLCISVCMFLIPLHVFGKSISPGNIGALQIGHFDLEGSCGGDSSAMGNGQAS